MRVNCSCPLATATETLPEEIRGLGITPIETNLVVAAFYDGSNHQVGEALVELFAREAEHQITVDYTEKEQAKEDRKARRKQDRARRNAKLHGH